MLCRGVVAQPPQQASQQVEAWLRDQLEKSLSPFEGWGPSRIHWTSETHSPRPDPNALQSLRAEVGNRPDHPKRAQLEVWESFEREPVVTNQMTLTFGNGGPRDRWSLVTETPARPEVIARDGDLGWSMSTRVITLVSMKRVKENEWPIAYGRTVRQIMLDLQFGGIRSATNAQVATSVVVDTTESGHWNANILWPSGLSTALNGIRSSEDGSCIITQRRFKQPKGELVSEYSVLQTTASQGTRIASEYSLSGPEGIKTTTRNVSVESIDEAAVSVALRPPTAKEALQRGGITQIHDRRGAIGKWTNFDTDGNITSSGQSTPESVRAGALTHSGWILLGVAGSSLVIAVALRVKQAKRIRRSSSIL